MLVDIIITHENGMRTTHQYTVPNGNNLQLVCTSDNSTDRTVYPLVQVPNQPIMGQPSQINPHYPQPGAAPASASVSEYRAKRLRDETAGLMTELTPCFFKFMAPIANPLPTSSNPPCYDPSFLKQLSYGSDQVVSWPMSNQSGERVVGPAQQQPKGCTYMCKICEEVFENFQAFVTHVNTHCGAEGITEERPVRQESKYKGKRPYDHLRLELSSPPTMAPESPRGTMHTAAPDLCRESGENSKDKNARDDLLRLELSSSSTMKVLESPRGIMHTAAPDICKESGEKENTSDSKATDLEKSPKPEPN